MVNVVAVGCDGSETSQHAVDMAADMARRYDARLVLLSAFQDHPDAGEADWEYDSAARLHEKLSRIERRIQSSGLECSTSIDEGKAGEVLVRLAQECEADLLVVGNVGMHRRVRGSVPNTVTHHASCSVLLVNTA